MNQIDRTNGIALRSGNVDLIEDAVNDVWSALEELHQSQGGRPPRVQDAAALEVAIDRVYAARDSIEDAVADLPAKSVSRRASATVAREPGRKQTATAIEA